MDNLVPKRHVISSKQLLYASPAEIFPLLCPKREYEWIPTWKCEMIYSESGYAEQDCIFATHFPNESSEIWVVDKFEKNKKIQFIKFAENRVIRYSVSLTDNHDGTTTALWEQTITALSEEGNFYIETFDDNNFSAKIKTLENLLNHFITTGEMLKS